MTRGTNESRKPMLIFHVWKVEIQKEEESMDVDKKLSIKTRVRWMEDKNGRWVRRSAVDTAGMCERSQVFCTKVRALGMHIYRCESLLPSQLLELNSGHQMWWPVPLPSESFHQHKMPFTRKAQDILFKKLIMWPPFI